MARSAVTQKAFENVVDFSLVAEHPEQAWALEFTLPAQPRWPVKQELLSFDSVPSIPVAVRVVELDATPMLQVQVTTTSHPEPLTLALPLHLLNRNQPHSFLLRYLGFRVDLFCDGVLVDEEWPMGALRFLSGAHRATVTNPLQQPRLRPGVLSDNALEAEYGGRAAVAQRTDQLFGREPSKVQYGKPRGWNTNAGDAMPFYHDGTFHLYYLIDRRHHQSKWGLGAHQWAHLATTDLVHWTNYPLALPISEQWEGSICTGSVFYHQGTYYAFYATRLLDRTDRLAMALSPDGIHFQKVRPTPFRGPTAPFREGPNRDPSVVQTGDGYLMLVTAALAAKQDGKEQGALEQLVSQDLQHWSAADTPFLIPGYSPQPECSDLFLWRGRYYLLFGINGVTHYRIGSGLQGPWTKPEIDILDAGEARVMKTAAFHQDRRLLVGWVGSSNFGGNLIFRELIQNPDGTLGTKFPNEMLPKTKEEITRQVEGSRSSVPLPPALTGEWRLVLRADLAPGNQPYGLTFAGKESQTETLSIDPIQGTVAWRDATGRIRNELTGLWERQRQATIEIVRQGDLVDICVNQQRTMIHRLLVVNPEVSLFGRGSFTGR